MILHKHQMYLLTAPNYECTVWRGFFVKNIIIIHKLLLRTLYILKKSLCDVLIGLYFFKN